MCTTPSAASRSRSSTTTAHDLAVSAHGRPCPASSTAIRVLSPHPAPDSPVIDADGFYRRKRFPDTAARMRRFERHAPELAQAAVERLAARRRARAHHASADHLLHRLFGARARSRADRALRLPSIGRAHHDRLHGLLCRDQRAQARAPHRALGAVGARARSQSRAVHAAFARKPPTSSRCCRSCCSATAAPRALVSAEPVGIALDSFRAVLVPGHARA